MNKDNTKAEIKLNQPLRGHAKNTVIEIDTDKDGIPLAKYWRDRFKDAEIDSCIELIQKKSNKSDKGSK